MRRSVAATDSGTVRPASHDERMTITMKSYALTWTDADGVSRASAVSYDQASADHRKAELEKAGATDIEIIPVKPGELPEPRT